MRFDTVIAKNKRGDLFSLSVRVSSCPKRISKLNSLNP